MAGESRVKVSKITHSIWTSWIYFANGQTRKKFDVQAKFEIFGNHFSCKIFVCCLKMNCWIKFSKFMGLNAIHHQNFVTSRIIPNHIDIQFSDWRRKLIESMHIWISNAYLKLKQKHMFLKFKYQFQ